MVMVGVVAACVASGGARVPQEGIPASAAGPQPVHSTMLSLPVRPLPKHERPLQHPPRGQG